MSEHKYYAISCDYRDTFRGKCVQQAVGKEGEPPAQLRWRLVKKFGWAARKYPPTPSQERLGIMPTHYEYRCPAHAEEIRDAPTQ